MQCPGIGVFSAAGMMRSSRIGAQARGGSDGG